VIGATYNGTESRASFASVARGYQILEDVRQRRPFSWVALDDDVKDWPEEFLGNVVATDPVYGIADEAVYANLKRKLIRLVEVEE
jgi:hypothetical protein